MISKFLQILGLQPRISIFFSRSIEQFSQKVRTILVTKYHCWRYADLSNTKEGFFQIFWSSQNIGTLTLFWLYIVHGFCWLVNDLTWNINEYRLVMAFSNNHKFTVKIDIMIVNVGEVSMKCPLTKFSKDSCLNFVKTDQPFSTSTI